MVAITRLPMMAIRKKKRFCMMVGLREIFLSSERCGWCWQ